jgi:dTMP kinase
VLLSEKLNIDTETLLMFAARREHIARVIEPALAAGRWVVSDRFTDATYAYQGAGGGMPKERIAALEAWVSGVLTPDLTLVFDVPVDTALARLAGAHKDRFESEERSYFERVRAGYLERAGKDPRRMRVINSGRAIAKVKKEVEETILSIC